MALYERLFVRRQNAGRIASVVALTEDGEPGYPSPGEIAAGPRFEHMVEHLHRLGPRAVAELLAEIAIATGEPGLIADRVEAYAALDPAVLRAVGGDSFPPMPLELIR